MTTDKATCPSEQRVAAHGVRGPRIHWKRALVTGAVFASLIGLSQLAFFECPTVINWFFPGDPGRHWPRPHVLYTQATLTVVGALAVLRTADIRVPGRLLLALALLPVLAAQGHGLILLGGYQAPLKPTLFHVMLPNWMPTVGWGLIGSFACAVGVGLTTGADIQWAPPNRRELGATAVVTLATLGLRAMLGPNHWSDAVASAFLLLAAVALLLRRATSAVAAFLCAAFVDALGLFSLRLTALEVSLYDLVPGLAALERLRSTTPLQALRIGIDLLALAALTVILRRSHQSNRATRWPTVAFLLSLGAVAALGAMVERSAMARIGAYPDSLGAAGDPSLELPVAACTKCGPTVAPTRSCLVVVKADGGATLHYPGQAAGPVERLPALALPDLQPLIMDVLIAADRRVSLQRLGQALLPLGDQRKEVYLLSAPPAWQRRASLGPWLALVPGLFADRFLVDLNVQPALAVIEDGPWRLVLVEGESGRAILLDPKLKRFEPVAALPEPLPLDASSTEARTAWLRRALGESLPRVGFLLAYSPETSLEVAVRTISSIREAFDFREFNPIDQPPRIWVTTDRAGAKLLFDAATIHP